MGLMYHLDQGVSQHTQAASWYRKAAEQGHAEAQNNLGIMYAKGWGVPLCARLCLAQSGRGEWL